MNKKEPNSVYTLNCYSFTILVFFSSKLIEIYVNNTINGTICKDKGELS